MNNDNKIIRVNDFHLDASKVNILKNAYNLNKNEMRYFDNRLPRIQVYINMGDIQPAIVYKLDPLIIACYNDEMDCILMLKFPSVLADYYKLKENDYLVTSNVYWNKKMTKYNDIYFDFMSYGVYKDVYPIVLKFFVQEDDVLNEKVDSFSDFHWSYIKKKISSHLILLDIKEMRNGIFYLIKGEHNDR